MESRIDFLIKRYAIALAGDDKICVNYVGDARKAGVLDEIISSKPQIIARLTEQKEARKKKYAEYCAKLAAIPGLEELQNAISDLDLWHEEYEASFAECGGLGVRPKPQYDLAAMRKDHPRAAAYLKARSYASSIIWAKSKAGQDAVDAILNGADYEAAIEKMEKQWASYCEEHVWD